jgi:hypothetical protein
MDPATAQQQAVHDTEDYLFLDPKSGRARGTAAGAQTKTKTSFSESVVFVVGGGSYVEYSDLLEYAQRASTAAAGVNTGYAAGPGKKRITYGSSEILKPKEFLEVIGRLAT